MTVRDDELLITREFDAPVALVFRLWEDRDHMLRWWGPEEFTAVELDWTLEPGRPWHGAMAARDYGLSRFGGVVHAVEHELDLGEGAGAERAARVRRAGADGERPRGRVDGPLDGVDRRAEGLALLAGHAEDDGVALGHPAEVQLGHGELQLQRARHA